MTDRNGHLVEHFPDDGRIIPPLLTPAETVRVLRLDVLSKPDGSEEVRALGDALRTLDRMAVTQEQIADLELPTRPTKQTDSRSASFEGESVELDAIPPTTLRQLVTDCIEQHIDADALSKTRRIEVLERETLGQFAARVNGETDAQQPPKGDHD